MWEQRECKRQRIYEATSSINYVVNNDQTSGNSWRQLEKQLMNFSWTHLLNVVIGLISIGNTVELQRIYDWCDRDINNTMNQHINLFQHKILNHLNSM